MKTFKSAAFCSEQPTVCALGCFDGVHIGHSRLILEAGKIAASLSALSAVWSFAEPPRNYFSTERVPLITTSEEKRKQMQKLGVDIFVSVPPDKEVLSLSAEDFFCEILIKRMNVRHIVCGYNYRFGSGGKGDTSLLKTLCEAHKIGLSVIPEVKIGEMTVSSSEIRKALSDGRISDATAMLGRPYALSAHVSDGQHLGRQLGFPTVNQILSPYKLLPRHGVYVSRIHFDRKQRYGITNIGTRPTVNENTLCAETHIFDFSGDLYGKAITVELLDFLRSEQKFSSLCGLKKQVNEDIAKAKEIVKK